MMIPVLVGVSVVAFLWCQRKRNAAHQMKKKGEWMLADGEVAVPLLANECSWILGANAVTTVTFYDGPMGPAEGFLRGRVAGVVVANPWLMGRLEGLRLKAVLVYPSVCRDPSPAFHVAHGTEYPDLHESMSADTLSARLLPLMVKIGTDCLGVRTEPLFRVHLLRVSDVKFALVVSLSHVLGDGHTFYALYGMLSPTAPAPRRMIVDRVHNWEEEREAITRKERAGAACDPHENEYMNSVAGVTALLRSVVCNFRNAKRYVSEEREVDQTAVDSLKSAHALRPDKATPFVSTNDVLMSYLFRRSGDTLLFMLMNFRGRLPGVSNDHAGNYEGSIVYQTGEDIATPERIRQSLRTFRRGASGPLPGFFAALFCVKLCVVTNWTSMYVDVVLPSATQTIHKPIFAADACAFSNVLVVYHLSASRIGVRFVTQTGSILAPSSETTHHVFK